MMQALGVKTFFTEATVLPEGKIAVDHVPFVEGENVAVFMMAIKPGSPEAGKRDLLGSVLNYDLPFEPAVDGD